MRLTSGPLRRINDHRADCWAIESKTPRESDGWSLAAPWYFRDTVYADRAGRLIPSGTVRWLRYGCYDGHCTAILMVRTDYVLSLIDEGRFEA